MTEWDRKPLVVLSTLLFLLVLGMTGVRAQQLDLDDQAGMEGQTVTFTLSVHDTPNPVSAYAVDIAFNPDVLQALSTPPLSSPSSREAPAQPHVFLYAVVSLAAGRVRVAGFTLTTPIPAGASGVLAYLDFLVIGPGQTNLRIVKTVDDVQTLTRGAGRFTPATLPTCRGREVTILGTDGDDYLVGTAGPDVIHGLGGHDLIAGLRGNDVLCGGEGHDVLIGGEGNDALFGDEGNDVLLGGNGNDGLHGGAGHDSLSGGNGNDRLFGDGDNDTLDGDSGDDTLNGGTGTDTCDGGLQTDTASSCEVTVLVP